MSQGCLDPDLEHLEEGDDCPCACPGVMDYLRIDNCSCHISPPCGACVSNPLKCRECGYVEGDEIE